jgi:hypothetical protein
MVDAASDITRSIPVQVCTKLLEQAVQMRQFSENSLANITGIDIQTVSIWCEQASYLGLIEFVGLKWKIADPSSFC